MSTSIITCFDAGNNVCDCLQACRIDDSQLGKAHHVDTTYQLCHARPVKPPAFRRPRLPIPEVLRNSNPSISYTRKHNPKLRMSNCCGTSSWGPCATNKQTRRACVMRRVCLCCVPRTPRARTHTHTHTHTCLLTHVSFLRAHTHARTHTHISSRVEVRTAHLLCCSVTEVRFASPHSDLVPVVDSHHVDSHYEDAQTAETVSAGRVGRSTNPPLRLSRRYGPRSPSGFAAAARLGRSPSATRGPCASPLVASKRLPPATMSIEKLHRSRQLCRRSASGKLKSHLLPVAAPHR